MSELSLFASFEYLCYVSTTFGNVLILSVRGPSLHVRIRDFWKQLVCPLRINLVLGIILLLAIQINTSNSEAITFFYIAKVPTHVQILP